MGKITLLFPAEQRRQIAERGGADASLPGTHGQQPLLGKNHIRKHIVCLRGAADEVDRGIRVISAEAVLTEIGQCCVEGLHRPVKSVKVKSLRAAEGSRVGINVRHDVLPVDGGGIQSVEQGCERLPADQIGVDHHAGARHGGKRI